MLRAMLLVKSMVGANMVTEGDFVYVKQPGCQVREGRVVSEGDPLEVRLEHTAGLIGVQQSEVWTTFDASQVIA